MYIIQLNGTAIIFDFERFSWTWKQHFHEKVAFALGKYAALLCPCFYYFPKNVQNRQICDAWHSVYFRFWKIFMKLEATFSWKSCICPWEKVLYFYALVSVNFQKLFQIDKSVMYGTAIIFNYEGFSWLETTFHATFVFTLGKSVVLLCRLKVGNKETGRELLGLWRRKRSLNKMKCFMLACI